MRPTRLIYLEDFTILQANAVVLDVLKENDQSIVLLDQTIFYPQGGGQPFDQGIIKNNTGKFTVEEVRFVEGIVKHKGRFEQGAFHKGDEVICLVNQERRELHSRLHSAGHVVDMAVSTLKLGWIPGKGYHFPDGPYVEYAGSLEGINKEKLKINLENLANQFITEARETKLLFTSKEDMKKVCCHVPEYLPADKPARVVMYGDFGVPCGGTHVSNLSAIKKLIIRKIKQDGPNIRIGYDIVK